MPSAFSSPGAAPAIARLPDDAQAARRPGTRTEDLRRVEGLAIVAGSWILLAWSARRRCRSSWPGMDPIDAMFESMSGLTPPARPVMRDFAPFGHGIFFWRALTHWLGGMGVIALFVAVLPRLGIGGRQLFFAEAPGPTDEKLTPQIRKTAAALWTGLRRGSGGTGAGARRRGCRSSTACATPWRHWLPAAPHRPDVDRRLRQRRGPVDHHHLHVSRRRQLRAALPDVGARGSGSVLPRDEEFRAYTGIVVVSVVLLTIFLAPNIPSLGRHASVTARFQALSILTTTGFASVDFQLWNEQSKMVLLVLMFIGGCAGSASRAVPRWCASC